MKKYRKCPALSATHPIGSGQRCDCVLGGRVGRRVGHELCAGHPVGAGQVDHHPAAAPALLGHVAVGSEDALVGSLLTDEKKLSAFITKKLLLILNIYFLKSYCKRLKGKIF